MKVIEEETLIPEEPERPLKRLRLRHQDGPSCTSSSPVSQLKKPKIEIDDLPDAIPKSRSQAKTSTENPVSSPQLQGKNKGKQVQPDVEKSQSQADVTDKSGSDSGLRPTRSKDKGKELITPQTGPRETRSVSDRPAHGVRFKEPQPKQTILPLIKPKDEPVTDDKSLPEVPLSVVRPGIFFTSF